jgi:hypothetical protein
MRMRLPLPSSDANAPANWAAMLAQIRQSYARYLARTPDKALTVEGSGGGF